MPNKFSLEVAHYDDGEGEWSAWFTVRAYKTREIAERAAERLEVRNACNGSDAKTRIVEIK